MYCVTVRQPWASLIVMGKKDIENRIWATKHRGPLLIHAASKLDRHADTRGILSPEEIRALPRGGIIGVVTVVDCVTRSRSPWFSGPFGWQLRNARALPFLPCLGQQGLFQVTPQETTEWAEVLRDLCPLFRT